MTYDVLVVGAGPAGAAAARAAALAGASTLLVEREQIPRYKRCGGGLIGASQAAVRAAGIDLPPLLRDDVGTVSFTLDGRRSFTRKTEAFLPMVLRAELDAALTDLAVAAGAQVRPGVVVNGYREADGIVTVTTRTGELQARSVVAADGSGSRAAAYVGVVCAQVDLGMEAELPSPDDRWNGHVLLDWGPVPGSYGWVFPKGDTLTVGVIGNREQGEQVRTYYRDFLLRLGLDARTARHDGGHLTRVRAPGSPLRRGNVLVAGDAAGLLEPWTREGISFALRSGALAGHAAATTPSSYDEAVVTALGADMAAGRRALAVFTQHPRTVYEVFRCLPSMTVGRARSQADDRDRWPMFDLFVRLVSGETTMADQLERRRIRALVGLLGG